jgi:hypothetical protein
MIEDRLTKGAADDLRQPLLSVQLIKGRLDLSGVAAVAIVSHQILRNGLIWWPVNVWSLLHPQFSDLGGAFGCVSRQPASRRLLQIN